MGCSQSKIENEEAVNRCKERKQFMKEAVAERNAFAAAHFGYAMSLKNTGAALSDYAQVEVQNPSLPSDPELSFVGPPPPQLPSLDKLFPPPPPPGTLSGDPGVPIQRSASMPIQMPLKGKQRETSTSTIMEDEEEDDDVEGSDRLVKRKSRNYRGSGSGGRSRREVVDEAEEVEERVTSTTMQASAMQSQPPQDSTYYYFFPPEDSVPGPSLGEMEEMRVEDMEMERKVFEEMPKRVEEEVVEEKMREEEVVVLERGQKTTVEAEKPVALMAGVGKGSKKGGKVGIGSIGEKRLVKESVNLLQVFEQLDDHFLKASESAHEVSKMLEATRLHYHSNFADNRGHIDHSARVMRVITWNRSFRGVKLDNDDNAKDDFDSEENETHATVLDKMLAWEKKLYDEVKAGELMKFEYQRKVSSLNKLKKRGTNSEVLEKAKAAVSHLHTRYIVDMQSMDSTVSEINRLRDEQLYPKLVQLVDGMATMWEIMKVQHESQSRIVTALKDLDLSQSPKETTEHHHERTIQLLAIVQDWHMQFCKLVDHQKEYIKALNNWLRLNLIPIESSLKEKVSSPPRIENPPIQRFLLAWQEKLDKLPDEIARSAINNFAFVIDAIKQHQLDEMKLKEKCEESRKELQKKQRQFEDWYHKYMQRRTPEELDPERTEGNPNNDAVAERQVMVELVKKRLEEEEEAYQRLCIQVREKSLVSLKNRLPELFRAMKGIAIDFSKMYGDLMSISLSKNQSHSS
ncbi:hypothetical protein REPUB_Repub14bG0044100 [Reevesia pubescens]